MESDVSGYKKLKEPSLSRLALISLPVGLIAALLLFIITQYLTSVKISIDLFYLFKDVKLIILAILGFISFNIIIIIVHEFLHAIIFPEKLSSDNIIFGVYRSSMFFAFYKLDMKRERMIICMLFPILLLSMVPLVFIIMLNINLPIINFLILYHITLSSGDLVGVYLILINSPKGCYLKNKGYHTYYRM